MRLLLTILLFLSAAIAAAQPPKMELTPTGLTPIVVDFPETLPEKLVELTNNWAYEYNLRMGGYTATNVSDNTITITSNLKNT